MRNLSDYCEKWDKKYFFAFLITFFCALMCGIVLYRQVTANAYFRRLACDYVANVFAFNNGKLILAHILGDLLYFYVFLLIGYFAKIKYIALIFVFLRGLFFGIYTVVMISASAFSGFIVFFFVFMPATLISIAVCYLLSDFCKKIDKKWVFLFPLALALADCLILLILENLIFRVIIIIV